MQKKTWQFVSQSRWNFFFHFFHFLSSNVNFFLLFSRFIFADSLELDASISATNTPCETSEPRGRQGTPYQRSQQRGTQNFHFSWSNIHRCDRLSKSIGESTFFLSLNYDFFPFFFFILIIFIFYIFADHEIEDRQQSLCQRFPRLLETNGFRSVSKFFTNF